MTKQFMQIVADVVNLAIEEERVAIASFGQACAIVRLAGNDAEKKEKRQLWAICKIQSIEPSGDQGMYKATLIIANHGAAVTVLGIDLTECAERACKIVATFKES